MKLSFALVLCIYLPVVLLALPAQECPPGFGTSGWVNDMGFLADAVSMGGPDFKDDSQGVCGTYKVIKTCEAQYQTRMRIYQSKADSNVVVLSFRPTQQNTEGLAIHDSRQMVPCKFLHRGNCTGRVHRRFQRAFLELMTKCQGAVEQIKHKKHIFVTGHSLGGALALFFTLHLWRDLGILPAMSIGFAGPFIGDEDFTDAYQEPLKHLMGDQWWQAQTVNKYNTSEFDGTVEEYNMGQDGPQIYIERDAVCGVYIKPLPVDTNQTASPHYSYGMHDLKNYRLLSDQGKDCRAF
ncbi:hypothetical protein VYU27_005891 [Nannochloropsis oceanica]